MFSEYASRFLSQSQRRPTNQQDQGSGSRRLGGEPTSNSRFGAQSFLRAGNARSPYHQGSTTLSRFNFTSRTPAQQAPLLYNTADEFREEDDDEEHQREVADFYALQRSRRAFGPSNLTESSEGDGEPVEQVEYNDDEDDDENAQYTQQRPYAPITTRGIRSPWREERDNSKGRRQTNQISTNVDDPGARSGLDPISKQIKGSPKTRLVDIALSQSERSSVQDLRDDDEDDLDDAAPAYSGFHFKSQTHGGEEQPPQSWAPESEDERARLFERPRSVNEESVIPDLEEEQMEAAAESPRHDAFWSTMYLISFASLFASAFLVYLHTNTPSAKLPLGDTVYAILRKSYHLLAIDTLIAIVVAAIWLALLRTYLRPLTYLTIMAVPVIFISFTLWPFITSFNGHWHGDSSQDKVIRIFSLIPLLAALMWVYLVAQSRHSIDRAIRILELASSILTASPALVTAGAAALAATVLWFWIWLAMFTRVFLEGHFAKKVFVIDASTWWLGIFYFLMLLWTQMIISGVQRATTAATVSQWYFYRNTDTGSTSREVVQASYAHATGPLFGTICLSTLAALLIRLPLIILPRRMAGFFGLCIYAVIPAPVMSITTPLTLTYAAIHSQPLAVAARGVSRLPLSTTSTASRTFGSQPRDNDPLLAYRTTHMLLHATRQIMTLALGLGAWMSTARYVKLSGAGHVGSAYAYVVGLGAAAVGWAVLGAVEGIVGGVVDGVLVCWASEVAASRNGRRFCPEAAELFGKTVGTSDRLMV